MVEISEKKTVYKNTENNNETICTDNTTKSNLSVMNVTIDQDYLPVPSSSENTILEPGQINNKEGRPRRGRKRKYPQQNRKEKRAKLNHGKEYINYKGLTVPSKSFVNGYNCSCKKKCTEKVTEIERKTVFENYWAAGSYEARCALLQSFCKELEKSRNKSNKRTFTRKYYLKGVSVCKAAFLKTLSISQKPLDIALAKHRQQKPLLDKRGCTGGHNKITEAKSQEVINFIKSLPKYKSHYCREKTNSKYLAPNLNLNFIYELYKEKYPEGVSKSTFKNIFYKKFNLRFKKPQKDTCNKCDIFNVQKKNLTGPELEKVENEHRVHLDKAKSLRQQMKKDMKVATIDNTIETLTFDLEKTNCLPRLPTNIIYYKRQLNLYNFGIHQASNNQGYFNIWLEHEGGRGTQEVGCCLKKFILNNLRNTTKELILWADSCGGQNKSIKLVLMLLHLLLNHDKLEKITMRFLQPGHTFLPNDSEFGDLECALKTHNRLYTVDDYINVMKSCRRKNKFVINKFCSEDFQSVEPLLQAITNRKKDINKEKVYWQKTFQIEMKKCEPNKLYFKSDVTSEEVQTVDIAKIGRRRQVSFKDIELPPLYPRGRTLSVAKIKDLKDMLSLIPNDAKKFYGFLKVTRSSEFDDDVDGFGEIIDFDVLQFENETEE
ncbi:unnamed protein product [Diatraea saccharalis]|uniref:DUF7869 domain-containing protein n=1 Tax=Diatraea saccharalis TaxID=40085 RepID=A0A9N9QUA1_9NEOP|nr:unnamed protein product [Diatraea saccharalis]